MQIHGNHKMKPVCSDEEIKETKYISSMQITRAFFNAL